MENQISTEVKSDNVIIFHTGGEKWVSQKQADYILEQSCQPNAIGTKIDGSFYKFSTMAKILTTKDYYEQYPDKRVDVRNDFEDLYGDANAYQPMEKIIANSQTQSKGLLKGLKGFIDRELNSGNKPENAIRLYEDKLKAYKQKYAVKVQA